MPETVAQRATTEARISFAYRQKYHIKHPDMERLEEIASLHCQQDRQIKRLAAMPQWQALAIQQYHMVFVAEYLRLVQEAQHATETG